MTAPPAPAFLRADGHSAPPAQWRSLEELAGSPAFLEALGREFPPGSSEWGAHLSRRDFLRLIAASLALAGGTACTRQPREAIVPYVRQPEAVTPGQPLYFATAMAPGGWAQGLLVRSHMGLPSKIDGNPSHPETVGRSNVLMQAEILSFCDPDRSQRVQRAGLPSTWEDFLGALLQEGPRWKAGQGAGLRLLTGRIGSPTLLAQIAALLAKYPGAKWHEHDPAFPSPVAEGICHFERAERILCLDADFMGASTMAVRETLQFALKRRPENGMNRLYVVESMPSLTGAMADHRLALKPGALAAFAEQVSAAITGGPPPADPWAAAMVRDLQAHRGRSLVLAGPFQPRRVQELAQAMNESLGNVGATIEYPGPAPGSPRPGSLAELAAEMHAQQVRALVILEANPLYTAPPELRFGAALARVPLTIHQGLYDDETAQQCGWHIPLSHFLESWSDACTRDGTASIVQPLIAPLYACHTAHELLAALIETGPTDSYEIVRAAWQQRHPGPDFERFWKHTLHDGLAPASPAAAPASTGSIPSTQSTRSTRSIPSTQSGLELLIRPDPHILDGRLANNGWLQELPKPLTKLTWENAAHLSPRTARRLQLEHGDEVELRFQGQILRAPAWVLPGHADDCVTVHLGYGRRRAGRVGNGLGFDAFALTSVDAPAGGPGLELSKTGARHTFATTQEHFAMEGRDLVRIENAPPGAAAEESAAEPSLYPEYEYPAAAWAMAIDLATCVGCGTCTIACQAENNIPVVGREQVLRGREMHWIRVDRYFAGPLESPAMLHQPVPCMHCEKAPCELVCPVAATVHDYEGLNVMAYNRCIGTRYCSNNCPYKVRRFNFLQYTDEQTPQLKIQRNPEVTVRSRGVMEKCTYCVQRIAAGRITAEKENRRLRDGEVVPACAQACPADAIIFGDQNDAQSRVSRLKKLPRNYGLLAELNTQPRTTYLAKQVNPNPEMPA